MRSLEGRIRRLEEARPESKPVAFITYNDTDSKAEAVAAWEADNGPIGACGSVFFTVYESRPGQ